MATEAVTPSSPSLVTIEDQKFQVVREGLADILAPYNEGEKAKKTRAGGEEQNVFYNPIQQFNRDLSILAAKVFAEDNIAAKKASHERRANQSKKRKGNRSKRKRDDIQSSAEVAHEAKKQKTGDNTEEVSNDNGHPESDSLQANGLSATESKFSEEAPAANGQKQDDKSAFLPQFRVLDALSATGLRALRYAKEIPEVTLATANDLSPEAAQSIKRNIEYNNAVGKVHTLTGDANGHMYYIGTEQPPKLPDGSTGKYDVIDLDPYGTAAPFIDSAVQAVSDGGMLAITCTDSSVFASMGYPEKTFALYGGLPWRGNQSHEAGLRLLIQSVAVSAAKRGLAVEPVLSLSIDYYVRTFIRVRRSPSEVKLLPGKTMTVFNCDGGCTSWSKQFTVRTRVRQNRNGDQMYNFTSGQGPVVAPNCEHCGFKTHIAGPMWGGPIHNPFFVQRMLDKLPGLDRQVYATVPRLEGMLTMALHETLLPPDISKVITSAATENSGDSHVKETPTDPDPNTEKAGVSEVFKPIERLDPAMPDHHPFFFLPSDVSRILHCVQPSDAAMRGALRSLGYRVTRSHAKPGSMKTDAPWSVIWEIMKAWVTRKANVKEGALKEGMPGWGIWRRERGDDVRAVEKSLQSLLKDEDSVKAVMGMVEELRKTRGGILDKENDGEGGKSGNEGSETAISVDGERKRIVFDEALGKDYDSKRVVRYQHNPRENWGPQTRAR